MQCSSQLILMLTPLLMRLLDCEPTLLFDSGQDDYVLLRSGIPTKAPRVWHAKGNLWSLPPCFGGVHAVVATVIMKQRALAFYGQGDEVTGVFQ